MGSGGGIEILVLRHFPPPFNAGEGGQEKSRSWSRIGVDREAADPLADRMEERTVAEADTSRACRAAKWASGRYRTVS